ncbi:transmembrane protein, putative [Medicago truncatula]|uniref:Transmembrane protein, putative n=1 Tax=Medicago truncatula TaxID=3880 RepID=G7JGS4_MEDTR|nr:transmembrane protein, putative [Medicago truncatula]
MFVIFKTSNKDFVSTSTTWNPNQFFTLIVSAAAVVVIGVVSDLSCQQATCAVKALMVVVKATNVPLSSTFVTG